MIEYAVGSRSVNNTETYDIEYVSESKQSVIDQWEDFVDRAAENRAKGYKVVSAGDLERATQYIEYWNSVEYTVLSREVTDWIKIRW